MKKIIQIIVYSIMLSMVACVSNTPKQNKVLGVVAGGAAGGALGAASARGSSSAGLIGIGAIVGALIGASIGTFMENSDKEKAYAAIATGKSVTWRNPKTKTSYTVMPAANYVTVAGNTACRPFVAMQTTVDGNTQKIYRTACRDSDGRWELINLSSV